MSNLILFIMETTKLNTLVYEFRRLSEKRPNDTVNEFKLNIVNKLLAEANNELEAFGNKPPIANFTQFDETVLPSNSDVLLVLTLYQDCF